MSSKIILQSELLKSLGTKESIVLIHTMEGEIWAASQCAIELFGFSNDELRQMFIANIKPKNLRLSDVCRSKKTLEAPIIFQKRNGKRFAAICDTTIIHTLINDEVLVLVRIELDIEGAEKAIHESGTDTLGIAQSDIGEVKDFIQKSTIELDVPINKMKSLIKQFKGSKFRRA